MRMSFKKICSVAVLVALFSPQLAFSSNLDTVKSDIVRNYAQVMPDCVDVKGVRLPDDFKDFVKGCRGHVVTNVKKRLYNISSPEITASCDDFDGDDFRTNVEVLGSADVVVSQRKLKSSTILDKSMMGLKKVGISEINGDILCKIPSDYSYTLKRNVNSDDIVYESYIRQSYAIRRSQLVDVTAESLGGIIVKTQAKATSNAYINDIVNVVNLSSHRFFKVRVTGYNEAEVI